jgi:hypothetical protein
MNISKLDHTFFLSVNPNKKEVLKSKISKELANISISNLICLNDDTQYESTVSEVQTTRFVSTDTFCENIHSDDIDKMFDKGQVFLELRLDDSTLAGFAVFDLKMKEKQVYVHILCANTQYKRVGTEIIRIIKDIATKLDYNEIQLHSVSDAIDFYIKLNFKCYKDSCMLEKVKSGVIVVVDTATVKEYIEKGYECIDNQCLMVYKIKDMNLNGGKRKTLKRRTTSVR